MPLAAAQSRPLETEHLASGCPYALPCVGIRGPAVSDSLGPQLVVWKQVTPWSPHSDLCFSFHRAVGTTLRQVWVIAQLAYRRRCVHSTHTHVYTAV